MLNVKAKLISALMGGVIAASPALATGAFASDRSDAQSQVNQSVDVVRQMEKDPHLRALLHRSKGVFVVPRFGQGGLVVGGRGGEGVVLAHADGHWSDPAFYNIGGVSVGAQAGAAAGSVAFILLSQNAFNDIMGSNNFSLNANGGLSIITYSAKSQAGWGKADVIVWSGAKGAYAGATIGITDIAQDQDQNNAFYKQKATVNEIFSGHIHNTGADQLVRTIHS